MPGFLVGIGKAGDVAERSPAVISANLKEDMLLQKKLVVLDRSERSVVHQIKVDQKVMYKRFQARLTCSKLAHARLMGERELQMQLRAKTLGTLNTDVAGNSDVDYAFLEKLEQRPCTTSSFSPRGKYTPPPWKQTLQSKPDSTLEEQTEETAKLHKGRSSSARVRHARATQTSEGKGSKGKPINGDRASVLRPATTLGTRVEGEFSRHHKKMAEQQSGRSDDDSKINEENGTSTSESLSTTVIEKQDEDNKDVPSENDSLDSEVNGEIAKNKPMVAFIDNLEFGDVRPKTVANITTWDNSIPSSPTSPKQFSRRTSRAADFFQAEEKIDMVALRLQAVKELDFSTSVHQFCEELEQMKCSRAKPDIDYYSMRLQMSLDQAESKPLVEVPGTPDDENKRSMGNVFVKSLTLPTINFYNDSSV